MTSNLTNPETETRTAVVDPVSLSHAQLSEDRRAARRRWTVAIGASILINVLLVIAILITLPPPPTRVPEAIPVRIVPPPAIPKPHPKTSAAAAKTPRPKPKPKSQQKPPPPGRLASRDLGDPKAPETAKLASDSPAAGPAQDHEGSEQPTTKGDATTVQAAKPAEATIGAVKPRPVKQRKPAPKTGGSRVQAIMEPPHNSPRHANYPGRNATKDAYLAYVQEMVQGCLTPDVVAGLRAMGRPPDLSIALRRNGTILWINIIRSTGSSTVDHMFLTVFDCVGRFPPVPDYITGSPVVLTYGDLRDAP